MNGFEMQNKSSGSFLFWTGFSGQKNAKPGQGMVGQRVKMIVYGLVVCCSSVFVLEQLPKCFLRYAATLKMVTGL